MAKVRNGWAAGSYTVRAAEIKTDRRERAILGHTPRRGRTPLCLPTSRRQEFAHILNHLGWATMPVLRPIVPKLCEIGKCHIHRDK